MTPEQIIILTVLTEHYKDHDFALSVNGIHDEIIASGRTRQTLTNVRKNLRQLRVDGMIEILATINEKTGKINGCGYFLTRKGRQF